MRVRAIAAVALGCCTGGCFFELKPANKDRPDAGPTTRTAIPTGAVWRYLDTGSAPADWNQTSFDDSSWKLGPAQLGYGDGDEQTPVGFGPDPNNKFITTYFRHSFDNDLSQVSAARLQVLRDDGVVVYVNGIEVFIDNLTAPVTPSTLANVGVSKDAENQFLASTFDPQLLLQGPNVVAVEIHQEGGNSTDISFDLALELDGIP